MLAGRLLLPSIAIPHNGHGFGRGGASLILDIIQNGIDTKLPITTRARSRSGSVTAASAYRQVHETSAAAVPRLLAVGSPYRLARNCVLKLIQVKEGMADSVLIDCERSGRRQMTAYQDRMAFNQDLISYEEQAASPQASQLLSKIVLVGAVGAVGAGYTVMLAGLLYPIFMHIFYFNY